MTNLMLQILEGVVVFIASTAVIGFFFHATEGTDDMAKIKGGRIVASFLGGLGAYYIFVPFIGFVALISTLLTRKGIHPNAVMVISAIGGLLCSCIFHILAGEAIHRVSVVNSRKKSRKKRGEVNL